MAKKKAKTVETAVEPGRRTSGVLALLFLVGAVAAAACLTLVPLPIVVTESVEVGSPDPGPGPVTARPAPDEAGTVELREVERLAFESPGAFLLGQLGFTPTPPRLAVVFGGFCALFFILGTMTRCYQRREFVDYPVPLALIWAVPATALFLWGMALLLARDPNGGAAGYVKAAFFARGPIPYFIVLAFWASVCALVLQYLEVRREDKVGKRRVVRAIELKKTYEVEEAGTLRRRLETRLARFIDTAFVQRIRNALERIELTESSVGVDSLLDSMSAVDAQRAEASHRFAQSLIFIMPALGFAGTIFGLGGALQAFSGAVQQGETVQEVAANMMPVIQKMGIAFDTTLLGLIGSAVVSLACSGLHKQTDHLLARIDTDSMDIIVRRLKFRDPSIGQAVSRLEEVCEQLKGEEIESRLSRLSQVIKESQEPANSFAGSVKKLGQHAKAMEKTCKSLNSTVGESLKKALGDFTSQLGDETGKVFVEHGKEYLEATRSAATQLAEACEAYSTQMEQVSGVLKSMAEGNGDALATRVQENRARLDEVFEATQAIHADLARLNDWAASSAEQMERGEAPEPAPALSPESAAESRPGFLKRIFSRSGKNRP